MDLYCTTCGEPWHMDQLHETEGDTFDSARKRNAMLAYIDHESQRSALIEVHEHL